VLLNPSNVLFILVCKLFKPVAASFCALVILPSNSVLVELIVLFKVFTSLVTLVPKSVIPLAFATI